VQLSNTHPFKTLVETITGSSTGSLDVPCSLTERVETELVGDLGSVHGVGQILSCQRGPRGWGNQKSGGG